MRAGSSFWVLAAIAAAGLPLAGCDSFNRAVGKTRVIPDEFQVVSNDPLAIPPDFALRPPRVGNGPSDNAAIDQARQAVFRAGDNSQQASLPSTDNKLSSGEQTLLKQAGAGNVPADIRRTVDTDPATGIPFERGLVDKLLFWQGPTTPPSSDVINPAQEASRIRLAQSVANPGTAAAATPSNGAGTPTFERETKKSGWFNWLF